MEQKENLAQDSSKELIPSFDDFMTPSVETDNGKSEKSNLEKRFEGERISWGTTIKGMSQKLKSVIEVAELMTTIYTERQRGLEYYHYLISLLIQINKKYRRLYAEKYDYYSYKSQKRFPNETSKNTHIQAELGELLEKRESLENHSKFMLSTVSTIDNIIYGIKSRIDIENIGRGK